MNVSRPPIQHVLPSCHIPRPLLHEAVSRTLHTVRRSFIPVELYYFHTYSRSFSCTRPTSLNSLDTFSDDEEMFRESGKPPVLLGH